MENLARICQLFEQRLGFNTQYLTRSVWEKAVRARMKELGYSDDKLYYNFLATDYAEFQQLVEIVVVPETWFFRDPAAIKYLVKWIKSFASRPGVHMARILAVPCSSGEEPYSIAMAFHDAGIPPSSYLIEGIDISQHLVERAVKGVYGKNAFRTIDEKFFNTYFTKKNEQYLINSEIRSQVIFKKGNIFDKELFPPRIAYDAVFCRNLLIYLHPEAQRKLLGIIAHLLKPEGRLFVAPSELETARQYGFQMMGEPQECALRLQNQTGESPWHVKKRTVSKEDITNLINAHKTSSERRDKKVDLIKQATELADAGQFEVAHHLCSEHLKVHKDDPAAYFLLGVITHASGDTVKAEAYFQKTVYLSPFHHEALVYLSLLMEKRGDLARSKVYRERAMRCLAAQHTESS